MAKPPEDNNFDERMKRSSSAQQTGYGSGSAVIGEEMVAPPLDQSVEASQSVSESSAPDTSTPSADPASGVDVASKFSLEEWKRIAATGNSFALIQNGEGFTNFVPDFDSNWENAKLAGLLRSAYHAFIAEGDPYNQADTFIKSLLAREDAGELPPALDITRLAYARDDYPILEAITTWIERVEDAFGKRPILFCNSGVLERLKIVNGGFPSWMNELPLWIARQSEPFSESFKWTFSQYKIDGLIEGVSLKIGFDYFNGSKADLETFAQTAGRKQRLDFALNDRPEGPDRLNYEKYADAFAQVLAGRYTQTPLTVGIYASWGMGKSFLLGKIRDKLKAVKQADAQLDFAFIDFNAWVYSGSENLWAGLVTKLYDGIEQHYEVQGGRLVQDYRLKESLRQLWRTFIKSLKLVLVFGIPAALYSYFFYKNEIQESWADVVQVVLLILGGAPVLSKLPDLVKGLKSLIDSLVLLRSKELADLSSRKDFRDKVGFMAEIQSELRHISDLINALDEKRKQKTRFIIFVDDLDRCPPEKAVEVLEAIMLLLSDRAKDPFIIFLAMDARVLVKAVEKRYGEVLTESGISGYEFLDKIVQIPFRIPDANNDEIRTYVKSLLYQSPEAQEKAREQEIPLAISPDAVANLGAALDGANQPQSGQLSTESGASSGVRSEAVKKEVSIPPEEQPFRKDEAWAFESMSAFMSRNPRRAKRIVNIYRLARILLPRSVSPEVAIKWVMLTEQWPFRIAWILQTLEDKLQLGSEVDTGATLERLYEETRGNVEDVRSRKLAMLDEDAEIFDAFIRKAPVVTTADILQLWDVTFNLNPAMQNEVLKNALKNGRRFGAHVPR